MQHCECWCSCMCRAMQRKGCIAASAPVMISESCTASATFYAPGGGGALIIVSLFQLLLYVFRNLEITLDAINSPDIKVVLS